MYKINNKDILTAKVEEYINDNGKPIELAKQFDEAMLEIMKGALNSGDPVCNHLYNIFFTLRETRDLMNEIAEITEKMDRK